MSKIEIGRYSALLRRALGMAGVQEVAGHLSPELSPTWQLEGSTDEWMFLKDVRAMSMGESIASGAGQGHYRIRNPANSGALCVITKLFVVPQGSNVITARIQELTVDLTNGGLATSRDTRWLTQSVFTHTAMVLSFQNTSGIGVGVGTIWVARTLANTPAIFKEQVILAPGWAVTFGNTSNAVIVDLYASWHERALPALEGPD